MKFKIYTLLLICCLSLTGCNDNSGVSELGAFDTLQGSLNKFTVSGNYLYIINDAQLIPYDISNAGAPVEQEAIRVGIGIETVITRGDQLFIGANDGMYIFSIADRTNPQLLSVYRHIRSCDPVAVQGDYAYVTLRSTTDCNFGTNVNLLDVVDISNPSRPLEVSSMVMDSPHGLAVEGEHLFVTQGDNGLDHLSVSLPHSPSIIQELNNIPHNADVIAVDNAFYNDLLIVTGNDGIYQYDYSDGNLKLISQLAF